MSNNHPDITSSCCCVWIALQLPSPPLFLGTFHA